MVCGKCEKKLGTVIVPDKWKEGALNVLDDTGKTKAGRRKLGGNSLAEARRVAKANAVLTRPCRICKVKCHQPRAYYCNGCAYKKGICSMCGRKVLDTQNFKMSSK